MQVKLQERVQHVQQQRAYASSGGLLPELPAAEEPALPASATEGADNTAAAQGPAGASVQLQPLRNDSYAQPVRTCMLRSRPLHSMRCCVDYYRVP